MVREQTSNVQRATSNTATKCSLLDVERWALSAKRLRMQASPQLIVDLPGIKKLRSGKVREVFDLGETLLFVVTDRLSAFDVILPDPIPQKGAVLNQLSAFWFRRFHEIEIISSRRISPSFRKSCSRFAINSLDAR